MLLVPRPGIRSSPAILRRARIAQDWLGLVATNCPLLASGTRTRQLGRYQPICPSTPPFSLRIAVLTLITPAMERPPQVMLRMAVLQLSKNRHDGAT